jgi:hypothetical protein
MSQKKFLLSLCFAVLALTVLSQTGAWGDFDCSSNQSTCTTLSTAAMERVNRYALAKSLTLSEVADVKRQIVAGTNWNFNLRFTNSDGVISKVIRVTVWEKLSGELDIIDFSTLYNLEESTEPQVGNFRTPMYLDVHEFENLLTFTRESLAKKYSEFLIIDMKYVEKIQTQLVSGRNYKFNLVYQAANGNEERVQAVVYAPLSGVAEVQKFEVKELTKLGVTTIPPVLRFNAVEEEALGGWASVDCSKTDCNAVSKAALQKVALYGLAKGVSFSEVADVKRQVVAGFNWAVSLRFTNSEAKVVKVLRTIVYQSITQELDVVSFSTLYDELSENQPQVGSYRTPMYLDVHEFDNLLTFTRESLAKKYSEFLIIDMKNVEDIQTQLVAGRNYRFNLVYEAANHSEERVQATVYAPLSGVSETQKFEVKEFKKLGVTRTPPTISFSAAGGWSDYTCDLSSNSLESRSCSGVLNLALTRSQFYGMATGLNFKEMADVKRQVVAGMNWAFNLRFTNQAGNIVKVIRATVWEKVNREFELVDFSIVYNELADNEPKVGSYRSPMYLDVNEFENLLTFTREQLAKKYSEFLVVDMKNIESIQTQLVNGRNYKFTLVYQGPQNTEEKVQCVVYAPFSGVSEVKKFEIKTLEKVAPSAESFLGFY